MKIISFCTVKNSCKTGLSVFPMSARQLDDMENTERIVADVLYVEKRYVQFHIK